MYSLIFDFNLNEDDKGVEQYLTSIVDEWPKFYSSVSGVRGTYFLLNALGLGGEYSFRQVVELDDPSAIRGIDEGMQKDANWTASRREWLKHRKDVRSTLVRHEAGDRRFMSNCQIKAGDRTLICKTSIAGTHEARRGLGNRMSAAMRGVDGLRTTRSVASVVNPTAGPTIDVWTAIEDYGALDNVAEATALVHDSNSGAQILKTQVFGIMRVDAGAFIHTA
jgi:hypothetical protein